MKKSRLGSDFIEPVGAWSAGLTAAIKLRDGAANRAPSDDDRPPPSTFPLTPASREALRLARGMPKSVVSKARRKALTYGTTSPAHKPGVPDSAPGSRAGVGKQP